MARPFFVYMLLCADGTYYVGQTDDLEARYAQHQEGGKCAYTTIRRPVELVWSETLPTREEAKLAERRVKKWSQAKKAALVRGDFGAVSVAARKRDWDEYERRKAEREDNDV